MYTSGLQVDLAGSSDSDHFGHLFAEELGLVLEVAPENEQQVLEAYRQAGLTATSIGDVTTDTQISISVHGTQQIAGGLAQLCVVDRARCAAHTACDYPTCIPSLSEVQPVYTSHQ